MSGRNRTSGAFRGVFALAALTLPLLAEIGAACPALAAVAAGPTVAVPEPSAARAAAHPPGSAAPAMAAAADPVARWRAYAEEASRRFGVPVAWIERVIRAESGGRTNAGGQPIVSPAGAMGLMQLMPATWSEMAASHALGPDPFDPRDNILAGTAYLAAMYRRFGYPGLFGAYNAGLARYAAWVAGRGELPTETRLYLARVTGDAMPVAALAPGIGRARESRVALALTSPGASLRARLFAVDRPLAVRTAPAVSARDEGDGGRPGGLFVALSRPAPAASGH